MRSLYFLVLLSLINILQAKNNIKALTESLGQEVIEIDAPIKELPPGLEEEPSGENEDEDKTTTTVRPGTKGESRRSTTVLTSTTRTSKTTTTANLVDDEARIEKELNDMYKDNLDYKADSAEVTDTSTTTTSANKEASKHIARSMQSGFKFQPNLNSKEEVDRFRTSIDDISCDKVTQKMEVTDMSTDPDESSASSKAVLSKYIFFIVLFFK